MQFKKNWRESLEQRRIADVWLAIRITATVFGKITAVGVLLICIGAWFIVGALDPRFILLSTPVAWLLASKFILNVWQTYYEGIVINAEKSELSFPATDVENSLIDIITLKRFFDHGRREVLRLASIETIMNETRTRRGHYAVNIAGSFGSRQFIFDSKQKRDEFRAAIDWGSVQAGSKSKQDRNLDTGGYGG